MGWIKKYNVTTEKVNTSIAAFGVILAFLLLRETRRQIEIAQEANRITLKAVEQGRVNDSITNLNTQKAIQISELSLEATNNSLKISEGSLYETQYSNQINQAQFEVNSRPEIGISDVKIELVNDEPIIVSIEFKNFGASIAKNLKANFEISAINDSIKFKNIDAAYESMIINDISPNGTVTNTYWSIERAKESMKKNPFYIRGIFEYTDIFKNNRQCYFITVVEPNQPNYKPMAQSSKCN